MDSEPEGVEIEDWLQPDDAKLFTALSDLLTEQVPAADSSVEPSEVERWALRVSQFLQQGSYANAIRAANEAVTAASGNASSLLLRASATISAALDAHARGDGGEAERLFNDVDFDLAEVLHQEPNHADALVMSSISNHFQGKMDLARSAITQAYQQAPDSLSVQTTYFRVHQSADLTEATSFADGLMGMFPQEPMYATWAVEARAQAIVQYVAPFWGLVPPTFSAHGCTSHPPELSEPFRKDFSEAARSWALSIVEQMRAIVANLPPHSGHKARATLASVEEYLARLLTNISYYRGSGTFFAYGGKEPVPCDQEHYRSFRYDRETEIKLALNDLQWARSFAGTSPKALAVVDTGDEWLTYWNSSKTLGLFPRWATDEVPSLRRSLKKFSGFG